MFVGFCSSFLCASTTTPVRTPIGRRASHTHRSSGGSPQRLQRRRAPFLPLVTPRRYPLLRGCGARARVPVDARTKQPYGVYRHVVSWGYRALPRLLFGVELFDSGSVKLVRRRIYQEIPVGSRSVFAEAERLIRAARAGFEIGKVDIVQEPREGGRAAGARLSTVARAVSDMAALWWRLRR